MKKNIKNENTEIIKHNIVKEKLESQKIYLADYNRISDATQMINLIQPDNARFAICKKEEFEGKTRWAQWIVNKNDLMPKINNILSLEDIYISLNSVAGVRRKIANLFSLNGFIVDLDYYKCPLIKGKTPEYVINFLREKGLLDKIEPSFYVYSGHGMYIIYLLENAYAKACKKIWKKILNVLYEAFKPYGADNRSLDLVHVFRLAGTINSKTGNVARLIYNSHMPFKFQQEQEPARRYTIKQLAEILLPPLPYSKEEYKKIILDKKAMCETKKVEYEANIKNIKHNNVTNIHTLHTLNYTRMKDLETLLNLRQGYCKSGFTSGNRELMCLFYRYWACCYFRDTEKAYNKTVYFNSLFVEPLTTEELAETNNVEEIAAKWQKAFNEYNAMKEKINISKYFYNAGCFVFSNNYIIKQLGITKNEMQHLKTIIIINQKEKNERNKEYRNEWKKNNRRNSEGLTSRKKEKQDKMEQIKNLLKQGVKQKDIAEELNISKGLVFIYKKEINKKHMLDIAV